LAAPAPCTIATRSATEAFMCWAWAFISFAIFATAAKKLGGQVDICGRGVRPAGK
jgi:hypothetical protein